MDIFKMLSDIAAVIKKPSGNTSADKKVKSLLLFLLFRIIPSPIQKSKTTSFV